MFHFSPSLLQPGLAQLLPHLLLIRSEMLALLPRALLILSPLQGILFSEGMPPQPDLSIHKVLELPLSPEESLQPASLHRTGSRYREATSY